MVAALFCSTHHSTKVVILAWAKSKARISVFRFCCCLFLLLVSFVCHSAAQRRNLLLALFVCHSERSEESPHFVFAFAVVFFQGAAMNAQPAAQPAAEPPPAATPPAHLRRLVLTGFMGAGKTTVGRLLAAQLNWEFLDLDAYIESRSGLSVPSIFAIHGEVHFRQLESMALASALGRSRLVLALGGGAPEVLTNRLLLEQTPATSTIFLDAPFPALFDRCMIQALNSMPTSPCSVEPNPAPEQLRPLLADPTTAEARFLARQPIYRRLARITI